MKRKLLLLVSLGAPASSIGCDAILGISPHELAPDGGEASNGTPDSSSNGGPTTDANSDHAEASGSSSWGAVAPEGGRDGSTDSPVDALVDGAVDGGVSDAPTETGGGDAGGADGADATGTDATGTDASGTDAGGTDAGGTDVGGTDVGGTDVSGSDVSGTEAGTDSGVDSGGITGPYVLQHHNNATRDGFYVDPALAKSAIHTMHLDTGFSATTSNKTYSQPLFMTGGVNGQDALFVATENNDVYALNPTTGAPLWTRNLGTPVTGGLGCGNISPLGVTGTPVIDPVGRALYVAAATGGTTPKHYIFSLSIDSGSVNWSLDVSATIAGFDSTIQSQRSALAFLGGKLFVPYGGLDGDCGNYKGRVIAVPVSSPTTATEWATAATSGSGIWGPSGIASDGTSMFVATGNTNNNQRPTVWINADSEAVLKLSTTPTFSGNSTDYFAPTDWLTLDQNDTDLGSSGVVLFDAPGATPNHLAFAIGKPGIGHLLDQTNLGGIGGGVSSLTSTTSVFGTLFAYTTAQGTYVGVPGVFSGCSSGDFSVLKVSNTGQLSFGWCATSGGTGGPISSSTSANGSTDSLVWSFGAGGGDGFLRAWDADTGANLFTAPAAIAGAVEHWTSPIIANGRIYVAGDGAVYAFGL